MTKHVFCRNKKYACHDKTSELQKIFGHDKHNFVATKVLSWQPYFCCDKRYVCRAKNFCHSKVVLVAAPANDKQPVHPATVFIPALPSVLCFHSFSPSAVFRALLFLLFQSQHCLQYSVFTLSVPALCSELCCFYSFSPSAVFRALL